MERCRWAQKEVFHKYHDEEWGAPFRRSENELFEALVLDGAQAGLSWETILRRREGYREAYKGFDPNVVAQFDEGDVERLLNDTGIIRNRLKVNSSITNARAFLEIQSEYGSFHDYVWSFNDGKITDNRIESADDIPANTELSDRVSADLKRRGMKFVGSTIIYALLQAIGVVNDHERRCFRYTELTA